MSEVAYNRMLRELVRIMEKADLATGFKQESDDQRDLAGRAAGAEGAVDLLIAQLAGLRERHSILQERCDELQEQVDGYRAEEELSPSRDRHLRTCPVCNQVEDEKLEACADCYNAASKEKDRAR